jgi:hypothetical protein
VTATRARFWLGIACAVAATALVVQLGGLMGVTLRVLRACEAALDWALGRLLS